MVNSLSPWPIDSRVLMFVTDKKKIMEEGYGGGVDAVYFIVTKSQRKKWPGKEYPSKIHAR